MTNYLLIGDIHLADNPPASRKEGYTEEVLQLLWQTVAVAKELNAVAIWAGDVFHLKTPGRNSHRLVRETIEVVKAYPKELYIVPGNHDITHDRLDSIPSQPLGVLFKSGANWLDGFNSPYPIYGVPWLQRYRDESVRHQFDKEYGWTENVHSPYPNRHSHYLVVTHAPLYPPGKELKYEFYDTGAWSRAMGGVGSVYYGHVHNPHGIYHVDGVQYCNNGALSRGSLDESNLHRDILATIWSDINGEFRTVTLNSKPASEIFRMEEKEKREAQVRLDDFLASIGQASLEITTASAVMEHIRSLQLGLEVEAVIQDLLDAVAV